MCDVKELLAAKRRIAELETQITELIPMCLELPSPRNIVSRDHVITSNGEVVITLDQQAVLAHVANTNSMDPVFDSEHTAILIEDFNRDALVIGDIIAYDKEGHLISHRIVNQLEDGTFVTQGDNCGSPDPDPVTVEQIKYLIIGVIY